MLYSLFHFVPCSDLIEQQTGATAFGDPHLLESAQRRQDRATNPHTVLSLRRGHHLDLHGGWCQSSELLGHALTNALEHGSATRQDHVGIKVFADVNITLPY